MQRERGVALLVTLLLLVAVLLLGASASTMVLLGERAARGERDRLIAFQAAEDGLMDAEDDINSGRSPVVIPTPPKPPEPPGQPEPPEPPKPGEPLTPAEPPTPGDPPGPGHPGNPGDPVEPVTPGEPTARAVLVGADGADADAGPPAWQAVDLESGAATEFGALSGTAMETGEGTLPFRRPRYFAERLARPEGGFYYRITVIGFGPSPGTETVLQTTYRRASDAPPGPSGRLSWREIANWRDLHAAAAGKGEKP